MVRTPGLYFVIANETRARFVRPDADERPHTIITLSATPADPAAGVAPEPAAAGARFARQVAARLNEDFAVDLFTDLVLVAPAELLGELLAALDTATGGSVLGSLARDLTAVPDLELWPHLAPWAGPRGGQVSSRTDVPDEPK